MPVPQLLDEFLGGPLFVPLIESPDRPKHRELWRRFLRELRVYPPSTTEVATKFHVQWHVCHHLLRELVEDDISLLDAARVWLPPHAGTGLKLYRGENASRFREGRIGWAWTPQRKTAEMFARGLNSFGSGGLLLRAEVDAAAIIAGPSEHSMRIDEVEFTIDRRQIGPIDVIAEFPPQL